MRSGAHASIRLKPLLRPTDNSIAELPTTLFVTTTHIRTLLPPSTAAATKCCSSHGLMALNRRRQFLTAALLVVLCYFWLATPFARNSKPEKDEAFYREKYPLLWKHVHLSSGHGGGASLFPPPLLSHPPNDRRPFFTLGEDFKISRSCEIHLGFVANVNTSYSLVYPSRLAQPLRSDPNHHPRSSPFGLQSCQ